MRTVLYYTWIGISIAIGLPIALLIIFISWLHDNFKKINFKNKFDMIKKHENLLFIIAILAVMFMIMRNCTTKEDVKYKPINDSTLIKANVSNVKLSDNISSLTKKTDSLKAVKKVVTIVYKEKIRRIYLIGPDTCKTYFDTIIKWHNKIDLINDSTISTQDSIIKDYSKMIVNYKDIVMVKDIQHYNDSLALRKQKRNKIKVGVTAFLGGLLIGVLK